MSWRDEFSSNFNKMCNTMPQIFVNALAYKGCEFQFSCTKIIWLNFGSIPTANFATRIIPVRSGKGAEWQKA